MALLRSVLYFLPNQTNAAVRVTHLSDLSDLLSREERVASLLCLPLKKSYQPLCLQQMIGKQLATW